ncbi:MAG: cysteine hydrolase family protein [Bacteroidota bacterium]
MRHYYLFLIVTAFIIQGSHLHGQQTALLLIDIQEFYFPGGRLQLENPEMAGMNAGLLLEQFRKDELPVYHVRHNFEPGGNIHQFVKPLAGEKVISKDQVNAFLDTDLLEALRADSVVQLVICGMQTHMCVEAAVRAAHDLGFSCLLVEDACATRALQYNEHIISAKSVHFSTIQTLQGTYARVVTTGEFLRDFHQILQH